MDSALVEQFRALPGNLDTPENREAVFKFVARVLAYYREFQVMKVKVDFWVGLSREERERFVGFTFQAYKHFEDLPRPVVLDFARDLLSISGPNTRYKILLILTQVLRDEETSLALQVVKYTRFLFQRVEGESHGHLWDFVEAGTGRKDSLVGEELLFELDGARPFFTNSDFAAYEALLLRELRGKRRKQKTVLKVILRYLEDQSGGGAGEGTGTGYGTREGSAGGTSSHLEPPPRVGDGVPPEIPKSRDGFEKRLVKAFEKYSVTSQDARVYLLLVQEKLFDKLGAKLQRAFFDVLAKILQDPDSQDYLVDAFQVIARLWSHVDPELKGRFLKKAWKHLSRYFREKDELREDVRDALETAIDAAWDDLSADEARADSFYGK
ncbi:MAG: hypothetical protein ACTSU5_21195 [Promethearchaeota archaeon]